jgi:hypothetical protein
VKKRYSEKQIIGFLREGDKGVVVKELSPARLFGGQILSVEGQVRWHGCVGCEAAEGAGS